MGNPQNLVAAHPGNRNRLTHGLYAARRELTPEAEALAEALMTAGHTVELDAVGALEIASLVTLIARVDAALADGRVENRRGEARSLIDLRRRLSSELRSWLREYGLSPAARSEFAARLAGGNLGDEIARRLAEVRAAKPGPGPAKTAPGAAFGSPPGELPADAAAVKNRPQAVNHAPGAVSRNGPGPLPANGPAVSSESHAAAWESTGATVQIGRPAADSEKTPPRLQGQRRDGAFEGPPPPIPEQTRGAAFDGKDAAAPFEP